MADTNIYPQIAELLDRILGPPKGDVFAVLTNLVKGQELIAENLKELSKEIRLMATSNNALHDTVAAMSAQIERNTTVTGSVIQFIQNLQTQYQQAIDQLANQGADVTTLNSLNRTLGEQSDRLAAAIIANTSSSGESGAGSGTTGGTGSTTEGGQTGGGTGEGTEVPPAPGGVPQT